MIYKDVFEYVNREQQDFPFGEIGVEWRKDTERDHTKDQGITILHARASASEVWYLPKNRQAVQTIEKKEPTPAGRNYNTSL